MHTAARLSLHQMPHVRPPASRRRQFTMTTTLEIPRVLPVEHLSASSISTYLKCPLRWKRKYVDREYEPSSGPLIMGSAIHAAEAASDWAQIETGERMESGLVQEAFSDEWEERVEREEVDWGWDKPGELKDVGVACVAVYDETIAPTLKPVTIEREIRLQLPDVEWGFLSYLDLEEEDGAIVDRKVRGSKMNKQMADSELAATGYMLGRRAEENPAPEFRYHTMVKTKTPYAEIVLTNRTDKQLDAFVDRIYQVAAEINWRLENDIWAGAVPGSWWCSERFCGYFHSCPMGGLK